MNSNAVNVGASNAVNKARSFPVADPLSPVEQADQTWPNNEKDFVGAPPAPTSESYDISGYIAGVPDADTEVWARPCCRASLLQLTAVGTEFIARADVTSDATWVFSLDGTDIATIAWRTGSRTATVHALVPSPVALTVGAMLALRTDSGDQPGPVTFTLSGTIP